jgi:hypothetical protein
MTVMDMGLAFKERTFERIDTPCIGRRISNIAST